MYALKNILKISIVFAWQRRMRLSEKVEDFVGVEPGAFGLDQIEKSLPIHAAFATAEDVAGIGVVGGDDDSRTASTESFSHDVEIKPFGGLDDFLPFRIFRMVPFQNVRRWQRRHEVGGLRRGGDGLRHVAAADVDGVTEGGRARGRGGRM